MKAIKIDEYNSVLIDTKKGFLVWVDVWEEEKEMRTEWNKYIFFRNCSQDMKIQRFQNNSDNFDQASSIAISYYQKKINKS